MEKTERVKSLMDKDFLEVFAVFVSVKDREKDSFQEKKREASYGKRRMCAR